MKKIAVSIESAARYGCPNCGYRFLQTVTSHNSAAVEMTCRECGTEIVLLAEGVTKFVITSGVMVSLEAHPREGLPVHGA